MAKDVQYVSDVTKFIRGFLKEHPEVIRKRITQRNTWWDVEVDPKEQKDYLLNSIKPGEYAYFSYNSPQADSSD